MAMTRSVAVFAPAEGVLTFAHVFSKLLPAIILTALLAPAATSDILQRRSPDPLFHFYLSERSQVAQFIQDWSWERAEQRSLELFEDYPFLFRNDPTVHIHYACAVHELGAHDTSIAECREILNRHPNNSVICAWAQAYIGHGLQQKGRAREAMAAYRQVEEYVPSLWDIGPVVQARKEAAKAFFGGHTGPLTPQAVADGFFLDPADVDGMAWALATAAAGAAERGRTEEAWNLMEELVSLLPPEDRRIGIASLCMAYAEINRAIFERDYNGLPHARSLIQYAQESFPDDAWAISWARLRLVWLGTLRPGLLTDGEQYARDTLRIAESTNKLPAAKEALAEWQIYNGREEAAVRELLEFREQFPYSELAPHVQSLLVVACEHLGDTEGRRDALVYLSTHYPQSSWGEYAKLALGLSK